MSQHEVQDYLYEAFHGLGNVNYPGSVHETEYIGQGFGIDQVIDSSDLDLISRSIYTTPADPPGIDWGEWNVDCDFNNDNVIDDTDYVIAASNFGKVADGGAPLPPPPCVYPVTWKWLDEYKNPVWLTAYVSISGCCPAVQNFSFNRSLGQISFNITSVTSGFCNVTVPKLLMDGAFKVFINDTQVPCMLAWNTSHTLIYFTYGQGTHNVEIIGEIVTRVRGPDLLSIADVNGDGIIDIVDIVIVALRFGWEEDG